MCLVCLRFVVLSAPGTLTALLKFHGVLPQELLLGGGSVAGQEDTGVPITGADADSKNLWELITGSWVYAGATVLVGVGLALAVSGLVMKARRRRDKDEHVDRVYAMNAGASWVLGAWCCAVCG